MTTTNPRLTYPDIVATKCPHGTNDKLRAIGFELGKKPAEIARAAIASAIRENADALREAK
jgi:hypothetical protein